jgi:hypothetical protein
MSDAMRAGWESFVQLQAPMMAARNGQSGSSTSSPDWS